MAGQERFTKTIRLNTGRLIRVEQQVGRLERRIEKLEAENVALKAKKLPAASPKPSPPPVRPSDIARLEKKNQSLSAEIARLSAKVEQNKVLIKEDAKTLKSILSLEAPVQALVRGFKQTPGAPFSAWRSWMLSTFRKQGTYRKKIFK